MTIKLLLQKVERLGRALAIRAIVALLPRRKPGDAEAPRWGERRHRVLFLRYDRVGDMIVSTGLMRVIAASHPTIEVHVVASRENAPVLDRELHIANVMVLDRWKPWTYPALFRCMRAQRYDAVIDWKIAGPSLTTLLLMLASGARHRIGVAGCGIESVLTLVVPPAPETLHMVEQLGVLAAPFGVDLTTTDWCPRLELSDEERAAAERIWDEACAGRGGRRFLVNVSAGRPVRYWPPERFVAAIEHVSSREPVAAVVVIGAPADRERAEQIARAARALVARTPGIRSALALVATADTVLTSDTSIAHAASAFARPAVALYSHGEELGWGLYLSPGHSIPSPGREVALLPVEPVLAALDDLLTRFPPHTGGDRNQHRRSGADGIRGQAAHGHGRVMIKH